MVVSLNNFSWVLDFHNHLIPEVDDGSLSLDASDNAIAQMREQGITTIITTPHLRASMLQASPAGKEYLDRVELQWSLLSDYAETKFRDLRLERGFEILLDVPDPDMRDSRTRLGGSKFLLTEFPFTSIPPHSAEVLFNLRMKGYEPIIAHPERYTEVQEDVDFLQKWMRVGVGLQVNAGSLIGNYGAKAFDTAWQILERGWASYLSSDYHATGECPTKGAVNALVERGGEDHVDLLCNQNPERILRNEMPKPVPPLTKRVSRLKRTLKNILGR